jgi:hypothetical protein
VKERLQRQAAAALTNRGNAAKHPPSFPPALTPSEKGRDTNTGLQTLWQLLRTTPIFKH